jgi:hypothetical protein
MATLVKKQACSLIRYSAELIGALLGLSTPPPCQSPRDSRPQRRPSGAGRDLGSRPAPVMLGRPERRSDPCRSASRVVVWKKPRD